MQALAAESSGYAGQLMLCRSLGWETSSPLFFLSDILTFLIFISNSGRSQSADLYPLIARNRGR
jgi:hypothetical protein